jgi:hypothetical protein
LIFDVDSITTQGDKIILKGAPQNEDFFKNNINLKYLGKLDVDNTHKNYNYSYVQNIRNLTDLQKISLSVELGTPNYNLYRFQKIQVMLTHTPTPSQKSVNNRLSGEWFIVDIKFEMNRGRYYQKILLVKRDLELSPEESELESNSGVDQSQTSAASNTNASSENTSNPTDLKNTDVAPDLNTNNNQSEDTSTQNLNSTTTTTTIQQVNSTGPSYTFTIKLEGSTYLAKVYNNGRLIEQRKYSSATFDQEEIKKELTFNGRNFGFYDSVGDTGLNPPQSNLI